MEPRSFETPNGLKVELRVGSGTIDVETADTAETTLEIRGDRESDDFDIEFTELPGGGHRLVVEERRRKAFSFSLSRDVRISLSCPNGTGIDAESGSADLRIRGRAGTIGFRSGSGGLSFDECDGNVDVKVASGDVDGNHTHGDFVAHSASGDIQVQRVEGEVVARTASGDVQLGTAGPAQITTASGDVSLDGLARGQTTLRSVSGDVNVAVLRGTKVWLDLSSVSGDTVSELDMGDGPGEGDAAALELRASTVSGDIRVRSARATGA